MFMPLFVIHYVPVNFPSMELVSTATPQADDSCADADVLCCPRYRVIKHVSSFVKPD